jgi:PKD repeat protein
MVRTVEIQVTPPPAPVAPSGAPVPVLAVTKTTAKVGELLLFDARGSYAEAGHSIVSWYWDFGDGLPNEEHGNDASHAYTSAGTYYAVLGVVDDAGRIASAVQTITVTQ